MTQQHLGAALGGARALSESLISSWESLRHPVVPPEHRLRAYATFFATARSVTGGTVRLLDEDELTDEERVRRDMLLTELLSLRGVDHGAGDGPAQRIPLAGPGDSIGGGSWFFPDHKPITIVCARLPAHIRTAMPYTDPDDPDYVHAYTFADLDSLIELHGHVRAINTACQVIFKTADDLVGDDLTTHLVLLGGVDWNPVTRDISRRLALPVEQRDRLDDAHDPYGAFVETGQQQVYRPVLEKYGAGTVLREDVGYFFRGPNPYNTRRTVTICNGMFGRGVYGAVRALTDARFRDRNDEYLATRFRGQRSFSVLMRVLIVKGETLTPDWTVPEQRLHEWPETAN